jgi:glycosyltransferase involved in cell wall biosynthesis
MGDGEEPLVSVVVPTYNRHDRLKRAIESVADQTYQPIEVLVVDDCSDVPVEDHLNDDYDRTFARFEILRHDENRGGSAARNTGMEAASGEYIALLDDDDRWRPPKIEWQVEGFREADVGVVVTGSKVVDEHGNAIFTYEPEMVSGTSPLTKQLLCRNVVGSCSAVMVDSDVLDAVGTFDERFPSWQDLEWYIRLSRHTKFGAVCEPLLVYSRGANERVSDDLDTIKDETYPLFLEKFRPVAAEYGPVFERKMRAWAAYRVGHSLVLAGRVGEGRRLLTKAVRLYPFESAFYKHYLPALGGTPTYETARKMKRTFDRIQ